MVRRLVLQFAFVLVLLAPLGAHASEDTVPYSDKAVEATLAQGRAVLLEFSADWGGTCRRQIRVIKALRAANSAYNDKITFVYVDWDKYSRAPVSKQHKVFGRTTLVMLKGEGEIGRLYSETSEARIKGLLDKAL